MQYALNANVCRMHCLCYSPGEAELYNAESSDSEPYDAEAYNAKMRASKKILTIHFNYSSTK